MFHHSNASHNCKIHQNCDILPVTNGANMASNDTIKIYLLLDQKKIMNRRKNPLFVIFLHQHNGFSPLDYKVFVFINYFFQMAAMWKWQNVC